MVLTSVVIDPLAKDIVQLGAWIGAVVAAAVAAAKAIGEARASRRLREEELRWRKAQLARDIFRELKSTHRVRDALVMLDWTGRSYEVEPGSFDTVSWAELETALPTTLPTFSRKEVYVRDCFDALFDALEEIEHNLSTGLIEFADVRPSLEYWVRELAARRVTMEHFWTEYGYRGMESLVKRFGWPLDVPAKTLPVGLIAT